MRMTVQLAKAVEEVITQAGGTPLGALPEVLDALVDQVGPQAVMELGGGRSPYFSASALEGKGIDFVTNDVSAEELAQLPVGSDTALFDVCGTLPPHWVGAFDLVYSRSVFEHLDDTDAAIVNSVELLRPGGVALHFFPTLWATPFVVNRLVPFRITNRLFRPAFKRFPARYRGCTATERRRRQIEDLTAGAVSAEMIRFYEHDYYHRIPPLDAAQSAWARLARSRGWHFATSYCFLILRKR